MTTHSGSSAGCTRENITKTHFRHDIKYAKHLLCLLKLYLFDQKYSKNCIKVKFYYHLKSQFFMRIYCKI